MDEKNRLVVKFVTTGKIDAWAPAFESAAGHLVLADKFGSGHALGE